MDARRDPLLTGTVTFLFSDIEESTQLVQQLDADSYRALLEQHHRLVREAIREYHGWERGTQGDSFLVIFRDAPAAVAAAVAVQRSLAAASWPKDTQVRVRMGLHTGIGIPGGDDYVGVDINRAARIASAAHGGQVLLSDATRALTERALPADATLQDLGEHRLKGLAHPERLFQLTVEGLSGAFPPPRSMAAVVPGSLPPRLTSFVGREEELDALAGLVGANRLLTVIGAGGAGKTALATELARRVAPDFADGAWFVALAPVADPRLVDSAIVAGLDLRGPSSTAASDRLVANLQERSLLLVLDNFEHVLEAAPLVSDLLASATRLKVVATSRAPLRIAGEQLYPVSPLELPAEGADLGAVGETASVQLFVDRARLHQPDFVLTEDNVSAVVDVCRRLEGLPLGIELATSRIALLGAAGIRDRLARRLPLPASRQRDIPARQRTLDDAIGWSHGLLDDAGRRLFARLSVFAGGWHLPEFETVNAQPEFGPDSALALEDLVEQSLVLTREEGGEVRFQMLEPIRDFAWRLLSESGDREATVRHHALAYLALAERMEPLLETSAHGRALSLLTGDFDNLLAAVQWSIDVGDAEIGQRLCASLGPFWVATGFLGGAAPLISAVLALPDATAFGRARMRALESAALVPYYRGSHTEAAALYREQLALAIALGDRQGEADARFNLTWVEDPGVSADDATRALDRVLRLYRELGDNRGMARAAWARAGVQAAADGQYDAAIAAGQAHLSRFRELDDVRYEVMALGTLSAWEMERGNGPGAARWLLEMIVREGELGDVAGLAISLPAIAVGALMMLGPEPAATTMGAFEALARRYGLSMPPGLQQSLTALGVDPLEDARAAMDEDAFERAFARGAAMRSEEVVTYLVETIEASGVVSRSS